MKTTLITLFALLSLHSPSFADSTCVPTKPVEVAQADYQMGLAHLDQNLQAAYLQATQAHDQGVQKAFTDYQNRNQAVNQKYQQDVADIRAHLDLGWRERLTETTNHYNQGLADSAHQYNGEVQSLNEGFSQAVSNAQKEYNQKAAALAEDYNHSVCAAR